MLLSTRIHSRYVRPKPANLRTRRYLGPVATRCGGHAHDYVLCSRDSRLPPPLADVLEALSSQTTPVPATSATKAPQGQTLPPVSACGAAPELDDTQPPRSVPRDRGHRAGERTSSHTAATTNNEPRSINTEPYSTIAAHVAHAGVSQA